MEFTRLNPPTGAIASPAAAIKAADIPSIAAKATEALEARKKAFVAAMMAETGPTAGWAPQAMAVSAASTEAMTSPKPADSRSKPNPGTFRSTCLIRLA